MPGVTQGCYDQSRRERQGEGGRERENMGLKFYFY